MPFYEYECQVCGHTFERLMKMGAEPPSCPATPERVNGSEPEPCGGETKKLISRSSFHLKGGGFYKTDYAT